MGKQNSKRIFDVQLLNRVLRYAKPYRSRYYSSIVLSLALAVLAPVRPWLINKTVNQYIQHHLVQMLITITVIQISLLILESVFRFLFTYFTSWLGQQVVKDLRIQVFDKILHLNSRQFDQTPVGTLTTRTINDIESISEIFAEGFIPILADILSIVAVLITMFVLNWKLTLVCLLSFPFLLIATYFFKESVNQSFQRVRNAVAALNTFVQEHIQGMQVVQAFGAEEKEYQKFGEINREHRNANIKAIFAYSVFFPVVEIILAVSMGLLVWYGSHSSLMNHQAEGARMAGEMMAFMLLLTMLFRPLRFIADKFNVLQMGMIASDRVFKVLDNTDTLQVPETGYLKGKTIEAGKIEFQHVWFAYTDSNWVLKNISFKAEAGTTVALVGHTGSGKTSIISLINRLYEIQKGAILIDGLPISQYEPELLRSGIGVVLQDVFLFSGSIVDNITLRNPAIDKEQVIHAARLMGMHEFIMQLPGGYDFNVMERGATLSQGQRQLLSFIRALLYNPSILILDEASSAVDTETELLLQKAIDTLIRGRTSIVIAHRLSTIRKADQILVLEQGEIREQGTHADLLEKNGLYARLHRLQFDTIRSIKD
ncbi:MAG: ABC transporter ATP-binding protein [Lacibacter sp.]